MIQTKWRAWLLAAALVPAAAFAQKPVATVNGVEISQSALDRLVAQGERNGLPRTAASVASAKAVLIRREVLWQEARRPAGGQGGTAAANAAVPPAQADEAQKTVAIRAFLEEFAQRNPVRETQVKATYERMVARGKGTEFKARDIVTATRDEAMQVLRAIRGGERFEAAAARSSDPQTRATKGDLGWGTAARFPAPVSQALSRLGKGQLAREPVASGGKFHVLMLEDRRAAAPLPLETMRPLIVQQLREQQEEELVRKLVRKARIR